MTDQKTPLNPEEKNDTTPVQTPKVTKRFDRTLRGRVAAFQCAMVRLHHRIHKKSSAKGHASVVRMRSWPLYSFVGENLYAFGFEGEYAVVRFLRGCGYAVVRFLRFVWRAAGKIGRALAAACHTTKEELLMPAVVFFRGIFHIFQYAHQVRREKGLLAALWEGLIYLGRGIRRYARLLPKTFAYLVPAAVAVACFVYLHQITGMQYTLAVQVNGATVGSVLSENVFESAKSAVDERINYAGTSQTSWNLTPTYTLSRSYDTGDVLDENEMADAILKASSDEIQEGTALYIDGSLCEVTTEGDKLSAYLESLKAPYEDDNDPNTIVQFNHDVELVNGIFFTDSFSNYDDVVNYISSDQMQQQRYTIAEGDSTSIIASKNGLTLAELFALNPGLTTSSQLTPGDTLVVQKQEAVLEIRIMKTIQYNEDVPYTSETTESDEYKFGTVKTVQEGVNGVQTITAQVTYDAAGNTLSSDILDKTVVQEPVTEKIVKGTYVAKGQTASIGKGSLMWPVPGYRYCSRWMSAGHKGVDICAAAGTPILAADSGVVVAAGYNAAGTGYGNSIIIDHGNGYRTLYAHCIALYVSAGSPVKQGQVIAGVGSTGRSTGNHCHFEIINNGSRVAPQSVFKGY